MSLAIVGATGHFGRDIITALLARGTDPSQILALGRDTEQLAALSARGLRTAAVDVTDERATAAALAGVETLLLISIGAPGTGLALRTAVVTAAVTAGVTHLVYTSALNASTTSFVLAAEHAATERVIADSNIPATFLRVGWYTDNLVQDFESARARGVIANSVADGRLATAPRSDIAEATAIVVTTPGHVGRTYELSGDTAWDYAEFAQTAQQVLGTPVTYQTLTAEEEHSMLVGAGLDESTAGFISVLNAGMRDDTQAVTTGDLARLLGRPSTTLFETLSTWK